MRELLQAGYLLHRRPYRESSELLEVFTLEHGRIGIVVRGLNRKRRGGSLASVLQLFRPLLFSYSGRGELATLTGVEAGGFLPPLQGKRLLSGFYLNELLLRLLHRGDPQKTVFAAYANALGDLAGAQETENVEPVLRGFEFSTLEALGYGVGLSNEVDGVQPLDSQGYYVLAPERGLLRCEERARGSFIGEDLESVARGDYAGAPEAAKRLARQLLQPHIGDRPLKTRSMFNRSYASSADAQSEPNAGGLS